jgi:dipeptidyl aminopeptidase/acylaminoacyl peptidase
LNLTSGDSSELFPHSNVELARWINDDTLLFTNVTSEDGTTNFWIVPQLDENDAYKATTVDGPVSDLQLLVLDDGIRFVFSSLANPNGTLYNPQKAHKPYASGQVYESLFVRHWDTYIKPEKSSIFSGTLCIKNNVYAASSPPKNLLPADSGLETPVQPFGGIDDFHFGAQGEHVVFVSKTPDLNPANNTQSLVYIASHDSTHRPTALNTPDEHTFRAKGASSAPKFSPDGSTVAYLQMSRNGYESDINKIYIFGKGHPKISAIAPDWDVSPTSLDWSPDGKYLYVTADNVGRHKLYRVNVETGEVEEVYGEGSVSDFKFLPEGKLLLTISTFVSSPRSYIFDPARKSLTPLQPQPDHEKGLSHSQIEDFWFSGADDISVHGFIIKPSFFKEGKKYKMAFFIHVSIPSFPLPGSIRSELTDFTHRAALKVPGPTAGAHVGTQLYSPKLAMSSSPSTPPAALDTGKHSWTRSRGNGAASRTSISKPRSPTLKTRATTSTSTIW